jgi:hypothetical protein
MLTRARRRAPLARLLVVASLTLGAGYAGGCTTADLSQNPPCTGASCTCEQDPQQPRCKGFNERDDASLTEPFDAQPQDASEAGPADAGDAETDGPDDGGDAAD